MVNNLLTRLRDSNLAKRGIASDPDSQLQAVQERGAEILKQVKEDLVNSAGCGRREPPEERLEPLKKSISDCVEAGEAVHTIEFGEAKRLLEEERNNTALCHEETEDQGWELVEPIS